MLELVSAGFQLGLSIAMKQVNETEQPSSPFLVHDQRIKQAPCTLNLFLPHLMNL